jgi:hypothetical protein
MAHLTSCQINTMRLILISPIHNHAHIDIIKHAHIDIIKSVAHLTNNKDVFLCILHYHCRRGLLQQYEQLLEDMVGPGEARKI